MKTINYLDCPCEIAGVPFYEKGNRFRRLNDDIVSKIPRLKIPDAKVCGARLRFRTNTGTLKIRISLSNVYPDRGMSFYQANVGNVFIGDYGRSVYAGLVSSDRAYEENEIYGTFRLDGNDNLVTVFLPRNPTVEDIEITVDDDAEIWAPTPYSLSKPLVFYGSSITENGLASSSNAYTALVSRWLDADYYNFGFSGLARGEKEVCEYIAQIDCAAFVMDYDHNAPDAEHLRNTHGEFFKLYRSIHPDTPVIMMSKPADDYSDTDERRAIIKKTYDDAAESGDGNVWFIDGMSYFGDLSQICTSDRTHPNELGHFLMAKKVTEVLSGILGVKPIIK